MQSRLVAISFAVAAGVPANAWADSNDAYYGHHMMWGGGWYGLMFGPLMMIVVIAAVIVLAVLAIRWLGGASPTSPHGPFAAGRAPLDILKERFARGEIDQEEFEERRRVLGD